VEKTGSQTYLVLHTLREVREFPLDRKAYWTVGRNQENDIVITDHCISRNHAILQATETGEYLLIDLGSRNGTFVNGRRVSIPVLIRNGDAITFGKTQVEYHSFGPEGTGGNVRRSLERDTQTSVLHERRLMTVMVADMRNFTGLARQVNEEVLSTLIGNWFREAGLILRQAGSWVDKYIGDAVMALWFHGEATVSPEEILQIFCAIGNLNQMTQRMNGEYPLPFPLRIGVGLNTGYAMVGNTGSGDHPDYTAIGDTVNAAFRLESVTKNAGFDLALGEKTYSYLTRFHSLEDYFQVYYLQLKGYDEPTPTYGITFEHMHQFMKDNQSWDTLGGETS